MESADDRALAERLAGPGSESLEVRGIRLRVVRLGPDSARTGTPARGSGDRPPPELGPAGGRAPLPLLLLHGFGASTFSFRLVLPVLAADRMVVAYDRPGFGLSERPRRGDWHPADWPRHSPYSPEGQADLAVALLDRLDIERAVVLGHSAGGAIAGLAAARHADRVGGLVLVDAAMAGPHRWALSLARLPGMRPALAAGARTTVKLMGRFFAQAWHDQGTMPAETVEGYVAPAQLPGWEDALMEMMAAGPLPDIPTALAALDKPVLVLWGEHDRIVPLEHGRSLAARLSRGELEVIPCCGHMPPEEQPQRFVRAVRHYLRRLPKADG